MEHQTKLINSVVGVQEQGSGCVECMEDVKRLIIHSEKDITLGKKLHLQLQKLLSGYHNIDLNFNDYTTTTSSSKDLQKLLNRLQAFRSHILWELCESPVIRSPTVVLVRLNPEAKERNFDLRQFSKFSNNNQSGIATLDFSLKDDAQSGSSNILDRKKNKLGVTNEKTHTNKEDQYIEKVERKVNQNQQEMFPCSVCKKIFRKKGHITRHLLTHEPEKPFGCDFCSKRFAAKYSLQMHLLNQHKTVAKPFECEQCGKRFTLKKELDQHILFHKDGFKPRNYPCHLCKLKFITNDDLNYHLETHPEANIYHCGHCEKSFPRKYNLTRHERTHSTEKPYHCDVCNKDFGTKNGLHMHLQVHETDENKPLSCHLCNKRFTVEQNLELHISFHNQSDEKPFPCDLCEVRFKTQERLEKHFETHGSIEGRVYPCQYCEKTFPRKYNLVRHELSHTHGRRKPKDGLPKSILDDGGVKSQYNGEKESEIFLNQNSENDLDVSNPASYAQNSISSKPEQFETHASIKRVVHTCQYCEQTFSRKFNCIQHELSHPNGILKYQTYLSNQKIPTQGDHHFAETSDALPNTYDIVFERMVTDSEDNLMKSHDFAESKYLSENSVHLNYLNSFKPETVISCESLGECCKTEVELHEHIQKHGTNDHDIKPIFYPNSLEQYIKPCIIANTNNFGIVNAEALKQSSATVTGNMDKPYPCIHCGQFFLTIFQLDQHELSNHEEAISNHTAPLAPAIATAPSPNMNSHFPDDNAINEYDTIIKNEQTDEEIESGLIIGF